MRKERKDRRKEETDRQTGRKETAGEQGRHRETGRSGVNLCGIIKGETKALPLQKRQGEER